MKRKKKTLDEFLSEEFKNIDVDYLIEILSIAIDEYACNLSDDELLSVEFNKKELSSKMKNIFLKSLTSDSFIKKVDKSCNFWAKEAYDSFDDYKKEIINKRLVDKQTNEKNTLKKELGLKFNKSLTKEQKALLNQLNKLKVEE